MMKRRINLYILAIAGAILFACPGCSDEWFNRQAGDRITPEEHWQDLLDGFVSWTGALSSLQEAAPRLVLMDGLLSDMMDVTANADQYMNEINEHNISKYNPYNDPSDLYKVIINLNEVLVHLDALAENERELDNYTTYYARGELLGMRAWTYLTLARLYGQVLYIPDNGNLTSLPEDFNEWRGDLIDKSVIIDTLINQLVPYIYDPTQDSIQRVEISLDYYINPKGILGELYLEKGDYANAVTYLKLACERFDNPTNLYKVDATYSEEAWFTIFLNAETAGLENMSVIPFSSTEDQYDPLAQWLGYSYGYEVQPTQILIDTFLTQVPSSGPLGDVWRGLGVTFGVDTLSKTSETEFVTANYINKYNIDQADPFSTDIILQRAADVHLLLAEAYNRLGDEQSQYYALMFLNHGVNKESPKPAEYSRWSRNVGIRGRVTLEPKVVPDGVTGAARTRMIEDMIITERSMELAFEGKRYFDLIRIAERRGDATYIADRVAAKFKGTPMYNTVRNKLLAGEWYLPMY